MNKFALMSTMTASLLFTACGKKPGSYQIQNAAEQQDASLGQQAEELWNQRADKDKLVEAMNAYEQLFAQNPTDKNIASRLVRGWYFYGDAYESEVEAKRAAWDKAISFGQVCLNLNPDYAAMVAKDGNKEAAASVLTIEDVPCTYWTASALGKWAKAGGLATTLKHIGVAKAYIAQVEKLDAGYFYGAVNRYWGAYYAGLPSFAGQDLERSQQEFMKSMEIAPDYLGTRILYADYWATKNQDKIEVFDEMVQYVMQVDVDALNPDLKPENLAEKKKAEELWAQREDKFIDAPAPKAVQVELPTVQPNAQQEVSAPSDAATEETTTEETTEEAQPATEQPAEPTEETK